MNGLERLAKALFELSDDDTIEQEKIEKVNVAIEKLSASDKTIILKRYGIDQERQYTLEEVANELGTTREAIRLREVKLYNLLKNEMTK